ncbi:MAG: ribonuclease HII [Firmicutes bacterium]|nr:ribonuclease HII [Bacillota bacterium]
MKTISEIKEEFAAVGDFGLNEIIEKYKSDERSGVKKIIEKTLRDMEKKRAERERLEKMLFFERKCYEEGKTLLAGIDEVGRGPLAGPVVTAAVILPKNCMIEGVNDSKKLSDKKRRILAEQIKQIAVSYSISMENCAVIDEINILQATLRAMKKAVDSLLVRPEKLLIDAVRIPDIDIEQMSIIKGDEQSMSIAAASIIAKVARDDLMIEMDKIYPEYKFANNVGYGSKEHIEAIRTYGPCPIHRRSFIKNFV